MNTSYAELQTRKDLASLYNLLYRFGWDDLIFTHTSARIPGTNEYLINRYGLMFNEITPENLVKIDFDGNVIGEGIFNKGGWPLHKAIHEARPEVMYVVHWHTVDGIAAGNDPRGILGISQNGMIVRAGGVAYHDYKGPVTGEHEYKLYQEEIGDTNLFLVLRNHGLVALGNNVQEAFWHTYNLQNACEIQVKSVPNPIMVNKEVEEKFTAMYNSFRQGIPQDEFWNALNRN